MNTQRPVNKGLEPNPEYIKNLFGSISNTYDKANDLMTFGMAHGWRRKVVDYSGAKLGSSVLDCATGTGDLAIEFKKVVAENGKVIGSDFCENMLQFAPAKAAKEGLDIAFEVADAMNLPYQDSEFDITSIAYGIRNVSDPVKALAEMARVTKKDGVVVVLETGENTTPILKNAIQLYFKHIVPRVGGWVSGNRKAYEYLNQSSSQFPCRSGFLELMESTKKFKKLEYKTLLGGASFIYKGTLS